MLRREGLGPCGQVALTMSGDQDGDNVAAIPSTWHWLCSQSVPDD